MQKAAPGTEGLMLPDGRPLYGWTCTYRIQMSTREAKEDEQVDKLKLGRIGHLNGSGGKEPEPCKQLHCRSISPRGGGPAQVKSTSRLPRSKGRPSRNGPSTWIPLSVFDREAKTLGTVLTS